MRRLLVLMPSVLLIAAAPPADKAEPGKGCMNHGVDYAAGRPDPGGFQRLDQLPPANEYFTVIRSIDGCQKPVIVRYNVDGRPIAGH